MLRRRGGENEPGSSQLTGAKNTYVVVMVGVGAVGVVGVVVVVVDWEM